MKAMDDGSNELSKKIKILLIIFFVLLFITIVGEKLAKKGWEHPDYVFNNGEDTITLEQGTYTLYFNKTSAFQESDNYKISVSKKGEGATADSWIKLPMKEKHMDATFKESRIETMYVFEVPKTDTYHVTVKPTQELTSEEQISTFNMKSGNMFFSNMIVVVSIVGCSIVILMIPKIIVGFIISEIKQNIAAAKKDHDNESK
ncbi:hypothetical protein [Bacillus thuringiensis]|uniref:hypothetical protein n=1 Tax=Bacillus thuringiensis TaxID=1428 RepID=UPI0021D6983B|nr:hypothetical protein [Bacillus thuringiensis]MCU7667520.1 hypothetical protein [Bacillus thuringiensis]